MEPNITLIWFVHPQWFQKMGAFARRENIPVFIEWCETAFKLFGESTHCSSLAGTFANLLITMLSQTVSSSRAP
jgi:beta-glucosidase/6-phospho-beta-glucosidase/beta-galactosidase